MILKKISKWDRNERQKITKNTYLTFNEIMEIQSAQKMDFKCPIIHNKTLISKVIIQNDGLMG